MDIYFHLRQVKNPQRQKSYFHINFSDNSFAESLYDQSNSSRLDYNNNTESIPKANISSFNKLIINTNLLINIPAEKRNPYETNNHLYGKTNLPLTMQLRKREKILLHTNRREEEEEKEKERREPHLVGSKLDRKQHAICRNDEMG